MMPIWERYFLKFFLKMFFLFLGCFYGLFVIIDYATHTHSFAAAASIKWIAVVKYYLYIFAARSDILIPLAILIASIYTIHTLNASRELIALRASGFSLSSLMRPFLAVGLFCVVIMYVNTEFWLPEALTRLKKIESRTKHQRKHLQKNVSVNHVVLEDGSLFFYQSWDENEKRFFDTYWIESPESVYRMKYLVPIEESTAVPKGFFVDHLIRKENGELLQETDYKELSLPQMKFGTDKLQSTLLDPDALSLTALLTQVKKIPEDDMNDKESQILTSLYSKLTIPWLCLLAAIAPAPFCARFSREEPLFLIVLCSLFGLIALYLFLDASAVLAKRQLMHPAIAITGSFIALSSYFFYRFFRINHI